MKIRVIDWVFAVLLVLTLVCSAYTAVVVYRTVDAVRDFGNELSQITGQVNESTAELEQQQRDYAEWAENRRALVAWRRTRLR